MGDTLQIVDPLQQPDWDAWLATVPGATVFHTAAWAAALHATYGFAPVYLRERDPARTTCVPLMNVQSWLTGRRGVGLPFSDFCPPCLDDGMSAPELWETLIAMAARFRWRSIEMRGGARPVDAPTSRSYRGHQLALLGEPDDLRQRFAPAVRRALRRAEQAGLDVSCGEDTDRLRAFYRLNCLTRRRHGRPPQPFRFFVNLQRHVLRRGLGTVVLVRHAGRPVAGAVFLCSGPRALFKYGASDARDQQLRGNNLAMWAGIRWCLARGCKFLSFGRTSWHNDGLHRFKMSWGCREDRIDYVTYDVARQRFLADAAERASRGEAVFRRLPIVASRVIGALAYRHVA